MPATVKMFLKQLLLFHVTFISRFVFSQKTAFLQPNCPYNFLNVLETSTLPVMPEKYNPLFSRGIGKLFM